MYMYIPTSPVETISPRGALLNDTMTVIGIARYFFLELTH